MTVAVTIPLRLPSAANLREHWRVRATRVRTQRDAVTMYLGGRARPAFPVVVTLTRIAPRALDSDNLQSAMKGTRDSVASWLGTPDNDPRIRWEYAQRSGGVRVYAVEIRIAPSVAT